jgi:LCP family protein required for cell wall assembly
MPAHARHRMPAPVRYGRLRKRRLMRLAGAVSLAVLTTSGLSHIAVTGLGDGIPRVDPFANLGKRPAVGAGQNFLLVGTDGRDNLTADEKERYRLGGDPCHCTDTIMLAHMSADRSRLSMISIPRDTYVWLPGPQGRVRPAKLNAAFAIGGPALTVSTVEKITGVHIDHYLQLDFISFMKTVDAVGGVPVCTARPLHDPKSGLDLPAGTTVLHGGQALEYVRARHLDATADLARMKRQQRFVAQFIRRATSSGVLLNPVRLSDAVSSALSSVHADKGLKPTDLIELGEAVRNFSPASAEFATVPVQPYAVEEPGIGQTVRWNDPAAAAMFDAIRQDQPLAAHPRPSRQPAPKATDTPRPAEQPGVPVAVDPAVVHVMVVPGPQAHQAAAELRATGFATVPATHHIPGAGTPPHTVITYDPGWDRSVRSLAAALPGAVLRPVYGQGPVMRVIVGRDFTAVTPVRAAAAAPNAGPAFDLGAVTGDQVTCP